METFRIVKENLQTYWKDTKSEARNLAQAYRIRRGQLEELYKQALAQTPDDANPNSQTEMVQYSRRDGGVVYIKVRNDDLHLQLTPRLGGVGPVRARMIGPEHYSRPRRLRAEELTTIFDAAFPPNSSHSANKTR